MSRGRCSLCVALTLALGACFSPTGSVFSTQSTGTGELTTTGATSSTTDATTVAPSTTSGPTTTDATTLAASSDTSTDGTTDVATASSTSSAGASTDATTGPGVCGDGEVTGVEQCDDGRQNGDDRRCTSQCQHAVCGDGLVCTGCPVAEECDDGGADDGCTDACLRPVKLAFVTSERYGYKFGGQPGADQLCHGHATAAGIHPEREFVAWLSGPEAAVQRLAPTSFRYETRTGATIAESPGDLLDGTLASPLQIDENGQMVAGDENCVEASAVWTGTNELGDAAPETCDAWSDANGSALVGNPTLADQRWTKNCVLPCGQFAAMRLYCIERG